MCSCHTPQGPARKIFIEFLERSCTAEFSGFLLYKELGRRLKKTNPVVAEVLATDTWPRRLTPGMRRRRHPHTRLPSSWLFSTHPVNLCLH